MIKKQLTKNQLLKLSDQWVLITKRRKILAAAPSLEELNAAIEEKKIEERVLKNSILTRVVPADFSLSP